MCWQRPLGWRFALRELEARKHSTASSCKTGIFLLTLPSFAGSGAGPKLGNLEAQAFVRPLNRRSRTREENWPW